MKEKIRILWIEDQARYDLAQLAAPVFMDRRYDLVVAETASDGIALLLDARFEAIIVDIRLGAGFDKDWIKLYQQSDGKVSARLGLHLLYTILGHPEARISLGDKRPVWLKPEMIGVLSVETKEELSDHLAKLSIPEFHNKNAASSPTILLEMIKRLLNHSSKSSPQSVANVTLYPFQQTGEHK